MSAQMISALRKRATELRFEAGQMQEAGFTQTPDLPGRPGREARTLVTIADEFERLAQTAEAR